MNDKIKAYFSGRRVLILGFAREGQSTYRFLRRYIGSDFPIAIADKAKIYLTGKKQIEGFSKDQHVKVFFGLSYLDRLNDYDLIIKSPGIPWNIKEIKETREIGIEYLSQTQIFLDLYRDRTIGITGTKGKSTTASLIYHILERVGKKVKLVGNIGKPVLDYIEDESDQGLFIFEMSSHQLSDVTVSPHIAVFLNIYPEHLDYYSDFEEYFRAKSNIAKYQTPSDIFIYNRDFKEISNFAGTVKSKKYSFSSNDSLKNYGIEIDSNPLLGQHNLNNIYASILVAKKLGLENKLIERGIELFKPLEDRLEIFRRIGKVSFVNDSLATIPQATIFAVQSFGKDNLTLILGGFDRGIDFDILGEYLAKVDNVRSVILIGATADKINKVLDENEFRGHIYNLGKISMKKIVEKAYEATKPEGVVLLSPAATSFDMFKDYKDRGSQFKKCVQEIK